MTDVIMIDDGGTVAADATIIHDNGDLIDPIDPNYNRSQNQGKTAFLKKSLIKLIKIRILFHQISVVAAYYRK